MTPADRLELAEKARANLARVIALLQHPTAETLDKSAVELEEALASMRQLHGEFKGKRVACPTEPAIAALRTDLRRAGRLLQNAWELQIGHGDQLRYSRKGKLVQQSAFEARWAFEV